MRRSGRKRKVPANFDGNVQHEIPDRQILPSKESIQPAAVQDEQPLPSTVRASAQPLSPSSNEHQQSVPDNGTGIRLLNLNIGSLERPEMVPSARAALGLHVSAAIKSKIVRVSMWTLPSCYSTQRVPRRRATVSLQ